MDDRRRRHEFSRRHHGRRGARLLDALDDEQRTSALWPFPSDDERRLWFYTPTDHGGLPLAAMDAPQQRLAFR